MNQLLNESSISHLMAVTSDCLLGTVFSASYIHGVLHERIIRFRYTMLVVLQGRILNGCMNVYCWKFILWYAKICKLLNGSCKQLISNHTLTYSPVWCFDLSISFQIRQSDFSETTATSILFSVQLIIICQQQKQWYIRFWKDKVLTLFGSTWIFLWFVTVTV